MLVFRKKNHTLHCIIKVTLFIKKYLLLSPYAYSFIQQPCTVVIKENNYLSTSFLIIIIKRTKKWHENNQDISITDYNFQHIYLSKTRPDSEPKKKYLNRPTH